MALSCHCSHHPPSSLSNLLFSPKKPLSPFVLLFSSSSSSKTPPNFPKYPCHPPPPPTPSSPWLLKWSPPHAISQNAPPSSPAIDRIVHRLRNLGLDSSSDADDASDDPPLDADAKLSDLLSRNWVRPDKIVSTSSSAADLLPWERDCSGPGPGVEADGDGHPASRRRAKAPTLAELTIEDAELRRLRRQGMELRERVTVPKAGVTQAVLEKIHLAWRKSELVRLKFHEDLAQNMKLAHELVERRTGGLVIWRSGSVMVVYRGSNYEWPSSKSQSLKNHSSSSEIHYEGDTPYVPDVSSVENSVAENGRHTISSSEERSAISSLGPTQVKSLTEEEVEYNDLLDGLGPRFVEWWGTGILPVDADLLSPHIPGYKTPFRLLPTGMRSRLTNAEITSLRKLAKSLPCHFALGRNRNHHGLATAILKLWEKSMVVKIAVKRGIQNTNNKLMAEELKVLTRGILLLRNKYYIVIYRGKDFVPRSVAAALAEREELTKDIQDVEEKARIGHVNPTCVSASLDESEHLANVNQHYQQKVRTEAVEAASAGTFEGQAPAGTLAEFLEAQARWGRDVSTDEYGKMKEAAARSKTTKMMRRIEHKLHIAQTKKLRAEKLLSKIEASMVPAGPSDDQETITDEERFMFRRVGLRMKAYLPLGIRGVFDGVIENMHLHWKHRELVKLISKQKTLSFVEDTARLLEYESGGILVAIERVPKGFALIYYRGKNYQRPINLRPKNLLTKAKALKRSVAMQRHEALSQHISELESNIEKLKSELGVSNDLEGETSWESEGNRYGGPEFSLSEDEDSFRDSDDEGDDDYDDDEMMI